MVLSRKSRRCGQAPGPSKDEPGAFHAHIVDNCPIAGYDAGMTKPNPTDLLSVAQAAAIIGLDESQVRRYCRAGRLPADQISGAWVIRRADAEAFKPEPRGR